MSRMSWLTRTDQNRLSLGFSSLWKLRLGLVGLICRSKAVVFTAFCSSPVSRERLSVKVSAIRKSIERESARSPNGVRIGGNVRDPSDQKGPFRRTPDGHQCVERGHASHRF